MSEKLRNIGPKSMAWLRQTGVRTLDDLKAVGALSAYVRVKRAGFKPSLNLLYALEGAILDCHWQEIPEERRSVLILEAGEAVALLPQPKGKRMPVAGPVTTTRNDEDEHAVLPDPDGYGGFDEPSTGGDEAG
jgi:DNA transformation protein and related proteins